MFGRVTPLKSLRVGDRVRTGRDLKTIIAMVPKGAGHTVLQLDNGNSMVVDNRAAIIAVKAGE